jgi:hypothetical protein
MDGIVIRRKLRWLLVCMLLVFSSAPAASDSASATSARTPHTAMNEQLKVQALQGAVWTLVSTEDGSITVDAAGVMDARVWPWGISKMVRPAAVPMYLRPAGRFARFD